MPGFGTSACSFGYFSLLDPSKNETWAVLETLVRELGTFSADTDPGAAGAQAVFFHIGGDELHWDCWNVSHINARCPRSASDQVTIKGSHDITCSVCRTLLQEMACARLHGTGDGPDNAHPPATPVPPSCYLRLSSIHGT